MNSPEGGGWFCGFEDKIVKKGASVIDEVKRVADKVFLQVIFGPNCSKERALQILDASREVLEESRLKENDNK